MYVLGAVHSMGLGHLYSDKCLLLGHHAEYFTALRVLCSALCPIQPLETNELFIVSVVLPFPESHIVEIIQYVAFSDWFLSLSNIHLRLLQVFLWFDSSFIFSTD